MRFETRSNIIKSVVIIGIVIAILVGIYAVLTGALDTTGQAKDSIHSVDQTMFWNTWNVWLTNDHPTGQPGTDNYYSAIYSVKKSNTDLIAQIQAAAGTDQRYVIKYVNHYYVFPWDLSSDVEIISITPVTT